MVRNTALLLLLILCVAKFEINAQGATRQELFDDGNYFFNNEDYTEALYYFLELLKKDSVNAHYNFKAGACLVQIPGEEPRAIPYLRKCEGKLNRKFRKNDFSDKSAPYHALFYLGNAYRMNNEIDKALAVYQKFISLPDIYELYNYTVIQEEITRCERAKIIFDSPIELLSKNIGQPLNNELSNINPVVSADESTFVFVSKLKFYDAIMISYRTPNGWTIPENINP